MTRETKATEITKPSQLLELALKDLEICEMDPRYEIDMRSWHEYDEDIGKCLVCLAGSVMANTIGLPFTHFAVADWISEKWENKLHALDFFREGKIKRAFILLGLLVTHIRLSLTDEVDITPYEESPKQFKEDLRNLVEMLKEHNL